MEGKSAKPLGKGIRLVVDANVLFSALIKDSVTAEILFLDLEFYTPAYIMEEFIKHKKEILMKTKRSEQSFVGFMHILAERIKVIPEDRYAKYIDLVGRFSPDENDNHYLALAMYLDCPVWTNDKRLNNQDKVKIISTSELLTLII